MASSYYDDDDDEGLVVEGRSLPVVDVSALRSEGRASASASDRLQAALALDASLTQWGFLYLKGHKISTQLLRDARDAVRTFLSQPDDAKAPFALGANGNNRFRGWKRLGENVTRYGGDGDPDDPNAAFARDQHEGIDLYEELPDACLPADSWARGVTA